MLGFALTFLLVSAPQGVGGDFVWPPTTGKPLHYRAELEKKRELDGPARKAERAARRAAGMYAPSSSPRRRVALTVDVSLVPNDRTVKASYIVQLRRQSLHVEVVQPDKSGDTGPDTSVADPDLAVFAAAWGVPATAKTGRLRVPRHAFEPSFAQTFQRGERGLPRLAPVPGAIGTHLLPVAWETPLPAWIEQVVAIVDLSGATAIEGKSLIQEKTDYTGLGVRASRAEVMFAKASASAMTLRYKLQIDQRVERAIDRKTRLPRPFRWRIEVEGEADYSQREHVFDEVREKVTARVVEPDAEKLCALTHEAFVGQIKIKRVTAPKPKRRTRR